MKLQALLFLSFSCLVNCKYTCTDSDCHDCIEDTCNLTCQGVDCKDCPNGDCCDGDNCNVCVASVCCSTAKCNECVKENRETCLEESSSSDCDNLVGEKCGLSVDKAVFDVNGNYDKNTHNITTIIKIHNLINSTNVIDTPIVLNLTNIDDIMVNNSGRLGVRRRKSCCSIIHPRECHTINGLPNRICYTRKHRECSSLCANSTNILIRNGPSGTNRCIVIAVHPYYYCGYYTTEDCSACYNCEGRSKIECLEDSSCSVACRSSVLPRKFYNVPYYIKTIDDTNNTDDADNTDNIEIPPAQK